MAFKGEELKIEAPKSMKNFENPVNEWMNACMHEWLTEWMNESEWMHACMNARVERWLHLFYGFNLLIKDDTSKANTNYSDNYSQLLPRYLSSKLTFELRHEIFLVIW